MHLFIYFNFCFSILQSVFAITHWDFIKKLLSFDGDRKPVPTQPQATLVNIPAGSVMKNNWKIDGDTKKRFKSH